MEGVWVLLTALLLTACAAPGPAEETPVSRQIVAMDTAMTFTVYGEGAAETVQAAVERVQDLETRLSRTEDGSEVSRLNGSAGAPAAVSEETYRLIGAAMELGEEAGGAFDITVAPVVSAWGFTESAFRVPEQAELDELLTHVGPQHIRQNDQRQADGTYLVELDAGTQLDLGGIAKGYASDCLAALFAERSVERGWVSLGGNVLAWGTRPDGAPWRIGIQDPKHPDRQQDLGLVGLEDAFAVTSGSYQRYFEEDGAVYHHIIDPATGYPADSGLVSVTVVAGVERGGETALGSGTMCDAFSTALFIMGEERALDFWRSSGRTFDLILVTEDGRVLVTDGIADRFTPEEGSGYRYETVS